ncbi:cardiolipin synthetase [compost metagenome]
MVMTADKGFAAKVAAMLEADFAQARRIGLDEFLAAPAPLRAAMHVAKLFAPIL